MRLLIVGTLDGHIATAGRLALESGAKVAHVDGIDEALMALRSGQGADMVMVEVNLDIGALCRSLKSERISVPVIACGIGPEPAAAANAIRAAVKEYGTTDDFIGVADDDLLVVITHTDNQKAFRQALTTHFTTGVKTLYNFQDAARGYLLLNEGTALEEKHPLMSVAVHKMR